MCERRETEREIIKEKRELNFRAERDWRILKEGSWEGIYVGKGEKDVILFQLRHNKIS